MGVWLVGYGSLIWRPDIPFIDRRIASVNGWTRRFWQGSHDHRGVPDAPGRVVTLIPAPGEHCEGMAYRIEQAVHDRTFATLDHREKNGYERHRVELRFRDGRVSPGVVYIATQDNFAYLGPAPVAMIAVQIRNAAGPSGANADYLLELCKALREHRIHDEHVFALERELLTNQFEMTE